MKRIAFTLLSLMLLTAASIKVSAQSNTETRQVSGFTAVASGGPFNVHIKLDGTESLKIDADADIIKDIETVVENGTLKIQFKDRHFRHENFHKADVYVTAKTLNALTAAGSGSMKVDGTISTSNFKIVLSGSGDVSTAVKSETLKAILTGSGSINLNGNTSDADFTISGSGQINGKELKTQTAKAGITGSGDVYVAAEKTVSAWITGSGNVVYSGSATIASVRTTGSGRVSKEN